MSIVKKYLIVFCCIFIKSSFAQNIELKQALKVIIDKSVDTNYLTIFLQKANAKNTSTIDKIEYQNAYVYFLISITKQGKALQYAKEHLSIYEKENNTYGIAVFANLVGQCYYFLNDKKTTFQYFLKAYNLCKQYNYTAQQAIVANNLGVVYIEDNDYATAENYLKESRNYFDTSAGKLKNYSASSLRLLGQVYEHKKEFGKAEQIFNQVATLLNGLNDSSAMALNTGCLARVYMNTNRTNKAFELNKKAILYANALGRRDIKIAARQMYIVNLEKAGNFQEALAMQKEIEQLHYNFYREDLTDKVSEAETKYKTAALKYENEKIASKIKNQKVLFIISFLSIIGLATFYSFNKIQKTKATQKLQFEKQKFEVIIFAEEKERIRIARELHDGVGQTMADTSMTLQALKPNINDEKPYTLFNKTNDLLNSAIKEMRDVSHSMVSSTLFHSGLINAIKEFIEKIELPNNLKIILNLDSYTVKQPIEVESSLYRIIQESVNNALKHAKATLITINLKNDFSQLVLLIEDNGIGFTETEFKTKDGIGLNNLAARAQSLKGILKFNSQKGNGTKILVQIPII